MAIDLEALGYEVAGDAGYYRRPESSEAFWYNEGDDQEAWVASVIAGAEDKSVFSRELLRGVRDWQSLYHLSQLRSNLLRPVAHLIEGEVLEVGAGMGAISRTLGEMGVQVTSLEASERRAAAAALRTDDLPNVQVVCDTIQNFAPDHGFDTIVVVGVLEYSRVFGFPDDGVDPVDQMLQKLTGLLNSAGRLVLAIENQLGLKYFAGYPEDHTGQRMFGVEDRYADKTRSEFRPVTFGKRELSLHLSDAGLVHHVWFYPFPDYKLPTVVLSDPAMSPDSPIDALPLLQIAAQHDAQEPQRLYFDLARAWGPVIRNGLGGDLANSFLLVASKETVAYGDEIAWVFGRSEQRAEFAKVAAFVDSTDSVSVVRRPLVAGLKRRVGGWERTFPSEPYVRSPNWVGQLRQITSTPGWTSSDLISWFRVWFDAVLVAADISGPVTDTTLLSGELFDALPRNLIVADEQVVFVDLEVTYHGELTLGDLSRRALQDVVLLPGVAQSEHGSTLSKVWLAQTLLASVGMNADEESLSEYLIKEQGFGSAVSGVPVGPSGYLEGDLPQLRSGDISLELEQANSSLVWANRMLAASRLRAEALEASRAELLGEMAVLRPIAHEYGLVSRQVLALSEANLALQGTFSWKLTRPLRALRSLITRGGDDQRSEKTGR